jgi:phospholipid/cholesterol/gamma-HCH transport system substrate-binding protein
MTRATQRYPKAFAERNLVVVAIVGLIALATIFMVTFRADSLPVIGGGKTYTAHFAEAGGLKKGNEVRIAGVKVGEVQKIELDGTTVVVKFKVKGIPLKDQTAAAIKVKTMLGQKFLAITPQGSTELKGAIPVENTTTPYDVNAAFSDLSSTIDEIDTDKMAESFEALAGAFENTPESVQDMIAGLTSLSKTVSSRDEELASLLKSTSRVSETLKDRNAEFDKLIKDGGLLLTELEGRRDAVRNLLQGTKQLSVELAGLVADNEKQLKPALARLDRVSAILNRNQDNLNTALKRMDGYYRVLASATGSGRWVDSWICGLFDNDGNPIVESDVVRNCNPKKGGGA